MIATRVATPRNSLAVVRIALLLSRGYHDRRAGAVDGEVGKADRAEEDGGPRDRRVDDETPAVPPRGSVRAGRGDVVLSLDYGQVRIDVGVGPGGERAGAQGLAAGARGFFRDRRRLGVRLTLPSAVDGEPDADQHRDAQPEEQHRR